VVEIHDGERPPAESAPTMRAVVLVEDAGVGGVRVEDVSRPKPASGEASIGVRAAAITRGELTWPVDRLPAIPSYEVSGVIEGSVGEPVGDRGLIVGDEVFGLTPFDRDGVAAEHAYVPPAVLARKPASLSHVEAAAVPMAALTAWQGLFDYGRLQPGERVLITGPSGGVGHVAAQLARRHGAEVLTEAPSDRSVDLVFDTAGGGTLAQAIGAMRSGGRVVSVAEEPPPSPDGLEIETAYFVVEPDGERLTEIARLVDAGELRPVIDSVYPLEDAVAAFERVEARGKRGKVVLRVLDEA